MNKRKGKNTPKKQPPPSPNSHSSCLSLRSIWCLWLPNSKTAFNHVSSQIAGLPAGDLQGKKKKKDYLLCFSVVYVVKNRLNGFPEFLGRGNKQLIECFLEN